MAVLQSLKKRYFRLNADLMGKQLLRMTSKIQLIQNSMHNSIFPMTNWGGQTQPGHSE